jgi:hypothetical protein|tara:strand:- start:291 stop:425 length:135 start_codon:yes stop_codon:yes gene_type:complete
MSLVCEKQLQTIEDQSKVIEKYIAQENKEGSPINSSVIGHDVGI